MSVVASILSAVIEIHSLIPDSILFGSLFLYFLTHNLSFGIFGLFLMELVLSHRFLSWVITQTVGPSRSSASVSCRAGYKTPRYQYERIFSHEAYPSYSVFSVTAMASYLGLSTRHFQTTMEQMGKEWVGRSTVAYVFIGLFIAAFLLARMYACSETVNEILLAFVLALIVGALFFALHVTVFGPESVNFLGLPYLIEKNKEGEPIYVCSPNQPL